MQTLLPALDKTRYIWSLTLSFRFNFPTPLGKGQIPHPWEDQIPYSLGRENSSRGMPGLMPWGRGMLKFRIDRRITSTGWKSWVRIRNWEPAGDVLSKLIMAVKETIKTFHFCTCKQACPVTFLLSYFVPIWEDNRCKSYSVLQLVFLHWNDRLQDRLYLGV